MGENLPPLRTLAMVRSVEWGPGRGLKSGQGDLKALWSSPGLATSALVPPNGLLLALGSQRQLTRLPTVTWSFQSTIKWAPQL